MQAPVTTVRDEQLRQPLCPGDTEPQYLTVAGVSSQDWTLTRHSSLPGLMPSTSCGSLASVLLHHTSHARQYSSSLAFPKFVFLQILKITSPLQAVQIQHIMIIKSY